MLTRKHFQSAANDIRAIRDGHWANDLPAWADAFLRGQPFEVTTKDGGNVNADYIRAVWTAEVFIRVFGSDNPRFDRARFLHACGLENK